MGITKPQLLEILEHDADTDLWLAWPDGSITAVPQDEFDHDGPMGNPAVWPRVLCHSITVNRLVRSHGEDGALAVVNLMLDRAMVEPFAPVTAQLLAAVKKLRSRFG